jgi:hypothetical protein
MGKKIKYWEAEDNGRPQVSKQLIHVTVMENPKEIYLWN